MAGTTVVGLLLAACGESQHGANGGRRGTGMDGVSGAGGASGTNGMSGASSSAAGSTTAGSGSAMGGTNATGGASLAGTAGTSTGGREAAGSAGMSAAGASALAGSASDAGNAGTAASAGGAGAPSCFVGGGSANSAVVVLDQPQQTMVGFGVGNRGSDALTDPEANQLFNTTGGGIGLTILRIGMASNGNLDNRNADSDCATAKANGATTFVGTVFSAYAMCKTNKTENDGGHLEPGDCYDAWATRIAAFPALVKEQTGVDLDAMSVQNEPDYASCGIEQPCIGDFPSMLYTAEELVNFIKVLGPKLHAASPNVKLMGPETTEWLHLWTNETHPDANNPLMGMDYDYGHALYADPVAWDLVDILATHQYDTLAAEPWPSDVPQTKELWMTEVSGLKWWPEAGPSSDIENGIAVAGWIHDAIVNGPASAWLYYNRIANFNDDNEGLILKDGTIAKRFYTLGNYSRFVRPGYKRVSIAGTIPSDVLLSAYQGSDGTLVVVAINKSSASIEVPITLACGSAPLELTPYVTSATDNLAERLPVPVSAGAFTGALAASSVTTFVGGSLIAQ
jgi:glucuronoarabinoxylan endo-1,4-beta-xylanase